MLHLGKKRDLQSICDRSLHLKVKHKQPIFYAKLKIALTSIFRKSHELESRNFIYITKDTKYVISYSALIHLVAVVSLDFKLFIKTFFFKNCNSTLSDIFKSKYCGSLAKISSWFNSDNTVFEPEMRKRQFRQSLPLPHLSLPLPLSLPLTKNEKSIVDNFS